MFVKLEKQCMFKLHIEIECVPLILSCKNQVVNTVQGNNRCLLRQLCET